MHNSKRLLDILEIHGQQFMNSFAQSESLPVSLKNQRGDDNPGLSKSRGLAEELGEEWGGIIEQDGSDDNEPYSDDFEEEEDEFTVEGLNTRSNVTVFHDVTYHPKSFKAGSTADMKAFMSSKITKLRQNIPSSSEAKILRNNEEDEQADARNDVALHRIIHTQLLTGSFNPNLDLAPAQRRKALAGRVLELSGAAKLGKGEKLVRDKERNKASKRVREGLVEKQKERRRHDLEEAKDVGNYHPTIKKLFQPSDRIYSKKRERGLKMGVGKFRGGLLKLSQEDVAMAEGGRYSRGRMSKSGHRGLEHGRTSRIS